MDLMSNGIIILIGNVIAILAIIVPLIAKAQAATSRKLDSMQRTITDQALQINTILQGDIRELRQTVKSHEDRLRSFETGESNWMRILRERTHDHANHLHSIFTDLELMKQGRAIPRRAAIDPKGISDADEETLG